MPDSFFAAQKPRKRKRSASAHDAGASGGNRKIARKGPKTQPGRLGMQSGGGKMNGVERRGGRRADEELDSDQTNDEDGGIEDMDLRARSDSDAHASGDEDEDETPAEKRLRLAQLYLNTVKEGLGECALDSINLTP